MARILGTIEINFDTDRSITQEQFNKFEQMLHKMVEDWEMSVEDICNELGFEVDSMHPIILDNLDCDFDD